MHMPRLSRLFFTLLAVIAISAPALKAQEVKHGLTWYTDINQVYELSKKSNKPIFAFFTGSDWCPACKGMQKTILTTPEFRA